MKDIKIVIGANFGDEGKGLMTRYFVKDALLHGGNPIVVFHNGTAQRGHTVDYNPKFRHVYHHFNSGTADGAPTFYAKTFWLHPMTFAQEYRELRYLGIDVPNGYCDHEALMVTPFDMLIDHASEAWITLQNGEREHGSCGYGTWCATDRYPKACFTISEYANPDTFNFLMEQAWTACLEQLVIRGVDVDQLPEYKDYFTPGSVKKKNLMSRFFKDIQFFLARVKFISFDNLYNQTTTSNLIFENGQGLGLDKDVKAKWHTTSSTGLTNPVNMLADKADFNAEVCYVTRSYMTRHGIGPMDNEVQKKSINADMHDKTNVPNEFQGSLRYGYLEDYAQKERIATDWQFVVDNPQFTKTLAITHCNEFPEYDNTAQYLSFNPYSVMKQ